MACTFFSYSEAFCLILYLIFKFISFLIYNKGFLLLVSQITISFHILYGQVTIFLSINILKNWEILLSLDFWRWGRVGELMFVVELVCIIWSQLGNAVRTPKLCCLMREIVIFHHKNLLRFHLYHHSLFDMRVECTLSIAMAM